MKMVKIPQSDRTPEVLIDPEKHLFQIKGNCLPENIREFSGTVLGHFEEYLKSMPEGSYEKSFEGAFRVHFRLGYFNSAAAKFIADIMVLSGNYIKKGANIKLYWYFDEDDHDMHEAGEEIAQLVNVPMEFIAVVKE